MNALPGMNRDRIASAFGVAAVHVALGYALIAGLGVEFGGVTRDAMKVFDLPPETPLPLPEEPAMVPVPNPATDGAAAPPDLFDRQTPIVAPRPPIQLPVPPPVVAAPAPGSGTNMSAGAATVAGPGTGAGGEGLGTGSGLAGSGSGGRIASRARHMAGRIRDADYPREAGDAGAEGTVVVHFTVGVDSRVSGCKVVDPSGNAELNATTCRVVERRFRYEPARDASGRAVPDVTGWKEVWWIGPHRPPMLGELDGIPVD